VWIAANLQSKREFEFAMLNSTQNTSANQNLTDLRWTLQFKLLFDMAITAQLAIGSSYEMDPVV
jgi:hypothetical protein